LRDLQGYFLDSCVMIITVQFVAGAQDLRVSEYRQSWQHMFANRQSISPRRPGKRTQINPHCFPLEPEYIRIAARGTRFQMTGEPRGASRHMLKTAFSARRADAKMSLGVIRPRCGSPSSLERRRRRFGLARRGQRRGTLQMED
jgi:hypothetical protein